MTRQVREVASLSQARWLAGQEDPLDGHLQSKARQNMPSELDRENSPSLGDTSETIKGS